MKLQCEWDITAEPPRQCPNQAALVFKRTTRIGGMNITARYPRCRKHASEATIKLAEEQGYTTVLLGDTDEHSQDRDR